MKKLLAVFGLLLALSGTASAQCNGIFPNNYLCGNVSGASAPPKAIAAATVPFGLVIGTTAVTNGTSGRVLYDNAGTLGEKTITGTGSVVLQTSPTFVTGLTTPLVNLSGTSNQLVFQSGGVTGTLSWTPATSGKTITLPNGTTDFTATGGTSQVVKQTSAGAAFTVARLACSDLSDSSTGCSAASGITALTGDVTATGPGSVAATLATVNANVGSFGSSTAIPAFTVNGKGLITAASSSAVIAPAGTLTGATLAAGVTASSLTSVGALAGGSATTGFSIAGASVTWSSAIAGANVATVANASGAPSSTFGVMKCDGTTVTCASGVVTAVGGVATSIQVGVTTVTSGTTTRILYDNAGVLGEYTLTGTGTVVVMAASPSIASPTFTGTVAGTGTIPGTVLANTAVTPASYTSTNLTVDAQGRITAASNGSAGGLSSFTKQITRVSDAANGDVAYTGFGFLPTSCHFQMSDINDNLSTGFSDSAKNGFYTWLSVAGGVQTSATGIIGLADTSAAAPATTGQTAIVKTYDADGFTLTWTKHGSPGSVTRTINVLCYK